MAWFHYLLEANLYLILGIGCFYLTLRRDTFYTFNRWFLILMTVMSFLLPFCVVNQIADAPQQSALVFKTSLKTEVAGQHLQTGNNLEGQLAPVLNWPVILQIGYFVIVAVLVLKMIFGIYKIVSLYRKSPKSKEKSVVIVSISGEKDVFSFWNWLFCHSSLKDNKAIVAHELVHIRQWHSLDLVFFDLVIAFNWFNPFAYLLFRAVKINHEFIADSVACQEMSSKYEYAKLLIRHVGKSDLRLSHAVSSSSQLERRIYHLGHQKSQKHKVLKFLMIFPLVLTTLALFSAFGPSRSYRLFSYHHLTTVGPNVQVKVRALPGKARPVTASKSISTEPLPVKFGPKVSHTLGIQEPKPKTKINALQVMYHWTANTSGNEIRKTRHSIFEGREAQLFRGEIADTLYVERSDLKVNGNEVELLVDQLMIASRPLNQNQRGLVLIDAKNERVIAHLPEVAIRTKGMIHEITREADGAGKVQPSMLTYNLRVQYALVSAWQILIDKEDKNAPYQPGILW